MPRVLSTTVFEALGRDRQPKFGAHIVAVMPNAAARKRLIESLNGSKAYGQHVLAKSVEDWRGLPLAICLKRRRRRHGMGLERVSGASADRSRSALSEAIA